MFLLTKKKPNMGELIQGMKYKTTQLKFDIYLFYDSI